MPDTQVYAGIDQPDVASLTNDGVFYRCYVWRNIGRNTIDYAIFTELEHGQDVRVAQGILRDTDTDGGGNIADCPRVLAVGDRYFIAHWIEGRTVSVAGVFRATFDTDDISGGWDYQGSTSLGNEGLYDAAPVEGTSDLVVARMNGNNITVARYEAGVGPYDWTDLVWSETDLLNPDDTVLAVVADSDNTVASYQSGQELWASRYDSADGANQSSAEIAGDYNTALGDDIEVTAVGLCTAQTSPTIVAVAEICLAADETAGATGNQYADRHLIWTSFRGNNLASVTSTQSCPNLHLVSRPWAYASAVLLTDCVYCLASFRSIADGQEWDQSYGFVLNLGEHNWSSEATAATIRPYPVAALNTGAFFDGRRTSSTPWTNADDGPSLFGKRMNHLTSVSGAPPYALSPDSTSVTMAAVFWEQLVAEQDSDVGEGQRQPAKASVRGVRFHHVDPWTTRFDGDAPALSSSENFRGVSRYEAGQGIEVAGGLMYSGGVMTTYDGLSLVENGFLWAPEIVRLVSTTGEAGIAAGTYWYTAVYEWTDSTGRVHRSAPARPVSVTNAEDMSNIAVHVRPINLTMKDRRDLYETATGVSIVLYRTALNDDGEPETVGDAPEFPSPSNTDLVFRMVYPAVGGNLEDTAISDWTLTRQVLNDPTPNSVARYTDLLPWQLDTATLQWTPATPIPTLSARVMATWKNRLWLVAMDDGRVIRYSDEILPIGSQTAAPEFFDTNTFRFEGRGEITAMHPMDDALIVWTRDAIYSITGEGNDGTGANATLVLQVLNEGTGCINQRSVVRCPPGILYQSEKGLYMLSRGQEEDFHTIGAASEDLFRAAGNVRSASLAADDHEIRFVCNAPPESSVEQPQVLVYDYFHKAWSVAPMPRLAGSSTRLNALQDGCMWRGRSGETVHVVLGQLGLAVERSRDDTAYGDVDYADTTIAIPIDVQTEWLHIAGISGFKRLRSILVELDVLNNCEITCEVFYDYNETATDSFSWTNPSTSAPLRIRPSRQKITSVMLRLYESGTVPATENIRITGLSLEVGIKKGQRRVADGQIGT